MVFGYNSLNRPRQFLIPMVPIKMVYASLYPLTVHTLWFYFSTKYETESNPISVTWFTCKVIKEF